jgi:putative transposase
MKPYSMEFREAVARAYEESESSLEVAEQMGCSEAWVRRLMQRYRATGSLAPKPIKLPDKNKLSQEDEKKLRELIEKTPDMTLGELAAALGNKVSVPTVWRRTQKLKLPLKKRPATPASRIAKTCRKRASDGSSSLRV